MRLSGVSGFCNFNNLGDDWVGIAGVGGHLLLNLLVIWEVTGIASVSKYKWDCTTLLAHILSTLYHAIYHLLTPVKADDLVIDLFWWQLTKVARDEKKCAIGKRSGDFLCSYCLLSSHLLC